MRSHLMETRDELSSVAHAGLAITGAFGISNCLSCTCVLLVIVYHRYYKKWKVFQSQNMSLIMNLMISDIIQSAGFLSNFHWFATGSIGTYSRTCTTQGVFIQVGDSATAFFVIIIACHTLKHFVTPQSPELSRRAFRGIIALVWICALIMGIVPRIVRADFYDDAGIWCWISPEYKWYRLYLHYLYLFTAEFLSIVIYSGLGIYLCLCQDRRGHSPDLKRAAKIMFMYPLAYTLGTMPLGILRILTLSGREVPFTAVVVASAIFSAVGGINCAVYVISRQAMLRREQKHHAMVDSGNGLHNTMSIPASDYESIIAITCKDQAGHQKSQPYTGGDLTFEQFMTGCS